MNMRRLFSRKNKGFTMAELLAVIAITLILSTVGIIAVTYYMRIMKHLEYDAMAKEIYVAAQNHLSMAYNEGYLGLSGDVKFGTKEGKIGNIDDTDAKSDIYYFVVTEADSTADDIFDLILPFGSIEEKIRSKSSYIIRYDKAAGRILDVFYSELDGTRYGHTFLNNGSENADEYKKLLSIRPDSEKDKRRYFDISSEEKDNSFPIVGYYGGDKAQTLPYGNLIEVPYIRVINNEELKVEVKIDPTKYENTVQFRLLLRGEVSNALAYITLKDMDNSTFNSSNVSTSLLDSITQIEKHFDDLMRTFVYKEKNNDKLFYPGENITVWVEAFDNTKLTNVAKSIEITTNSLFGDLSTVDADNLTDRRVADISNIRHLENLDKDISELNNSDNMIDHASQSNDLDWNDFIERTNGDSTVIFGKDRESFATIGHYYPVNNLVFDYDGKYNGEVHSIKNINVASNRILESKRGPVGLFGEVPENRKIENLKLIDFSISGSQNAGALAGTLMSSTVNNVVAYDSHSTDDGTGVSSVGGGSDVGGLIGAAKGSSKIEMSAAAVIINRGNNSGGLIGSLSDTSTVNESYAAGHTVNGKYSKDKINVTGTTTAGGLVGNVSSVGIAEQSWIINNSYSTCSVDGGIAGGFVGSFSSSKRINNSYSTGYVKVGKDQTNKGAFIGHNMSSAHTDCRYLIAPNDISLNAIGSSSTDKSIKAIDEDTNTYRNFISMGKNADAYDKVLVRDFKNKYLYKTVGELYNKDILNDGDKRDFSGYLIDKHYGDWADYQIFVVNN